MSLADELKNIVEEIRAGKAERRQRLGEIKKETTGDLSQFASARKKMATDLRESLAANTQTVKGEVSAMRRGFQTEHKQLKEEIQAMKGVWESAPEPSETQRKKKTYPKE